MTIFYDKRESLTFHSRWVKNEKMQGHDWLKQRVKGCHWLESRANAVSK